MIRHIPKTEANSAQQVKTMCGRWVASDRCIDLKHELLESAECKSCQRADGADQVRRHRKATKSFERLLLKTGWTVVEKSW